jgi:hypothetical protein
MVNVGIMEPDPENQGVMKVGKQIAPSGFLKKIQNTKVDYFDSNAAADAASKSFGGFTESTIQDLSRLQGKVVTIEDVRRRPGYEEAINEELNSFFSNPFNMTSILTNDLVKDKNGKQYVSNISGKDGNVIEFVFDPQTNYYKPNLTAEQEQAARDYMRRKIEQRLDIKLKEDPFNKPQPKEVKAEEPKPSGPPINVQEAYLSRVKEKTGLSEDTFSNKRLETANNMKSILSKIPNGTQLSVELDKDPESGIINLKDGDNVIKSFYVYETNPEIRKGYLNEFTEIISNLAGTDGMIDYLGRTGGMGQSGGGSSR